MSKEWCTLSCNCINKFYKFTPYLFYLINYFAFINCN